MSTVVFRIALVVVVLVVAAGCRTVERIIAPSTDPDDCFGMSEIGHEAPLTLELLEQLGWQAVVGTVTGPGTSVFNSPDGSKPFNGPRNAGGPDPAIVTVHPVTIERVIHGDAAEVTEVATPGGTVDCYTFDVQPQPLFRVGVSTVLFLRPGRYADGTPNLARPLLAKAWPVGVDDTVVTEHDGVIPMEELGRVLGGDSG
jgi:hypothetical protein